MRQILLLAILVSPAWAQDDLPVQKSLHAAARNRASVFGTANANCPQATCDTVWVGHSSSGPGGSPCSRR